MTLVDDDDDDDDDFVDPEDTYASTIEALLETESTFPLHERARRWFECLSACRWVQGGADHTKVEIRKSSHGAGVFAAVDIKRRTTIGNYPGVRRSLDDFTRKIARTNGRAAAYGLMCRDGWVLDPTDRNGDVAVTGFASDPKGVPGERGEARVETLAAEFVFVGDAGDVVFVGDVGDVGDIGDEGTETNDATIDRGSATASPRRSIAILSKMTAPTVSLIPSLAKPGGAFLKNPRFAERNTADATFCLANEPDGPNDEEGDLLRERKANIAVCEGGVGWQAVYTLRDVRAGEELLWDYGANYNREHYR